MEQRNVDIEPPYTTIGPKINFTILDFQNLWKYRDLLFIFIRRDLVSFYKQTILGPAWYFVQPLLTSLTFMIIFAKVAKISTDGIPHILFYYSGIVCWNYFAECFSKTSNVFIGEQQLFGKVYFPRLIVPLSIAIGGLVKTLAQFLLFVVMWLMFWLKGAEIKPTVFILAIPLLFMLMGIIGLSGGIIFSSLTVKYRDLTYLLNFGLQLLMYGTPIIYPSSILTGEIKELMFYNPFSHIVNGFRYAFFGTSEFSLIGLSYTAAFAFVLFLSGNIIFNRTEKSFVDSV